MREGPSISRLKTTITIRAAKITDQTIVGADTNQAENHRIKLPGPVVQEMMLGTWATKVKYEPSPEMPKGKEVSGREVWRVGPGRQSIIEEYFESNAGGGYKLFTIAWWDEKEKGQRFLACDNEQMHGCELSRSVARWEGDRLMYTEEVEQRGSKLVSQEIFADITPASFTQLMKEGPSIARLRTTLTVRATKITARTEPTTY
jgi:hypothetical protein